MNRGKLSEQEWTMLLDLCDRLEIDVRDLLGRDVPFWVLEAAGHRLGRVVAQATTERLTLARSERLTGPQPCPTCGELSSVARRERDLETGDGPVRLCEPVCHCSTCRRDFFPSASSVGPGAAEV
jgi:hypothetical protein